MAPFLRTHLPRVTPLEQRCPVLLATQETRGLEEPVPRSGDRDQDPGTPWRVACGTWRPGALTQAGPGVRLGRMSHDWPSVGGGAETWVGTYASPS